MSAKLPVFVRIAVIFLSFAVALFLLAVSVKLLSERMPKTVSGAPVVITSATPTATACVSPSPTPTPVVSESPVDTVSPAALAPLKRK